MHKPNVDPDQMTKKPVATVIWPSTPWNDTLENTVLDPVNYLLVGAITWLLGITLSIFQVGPSIAGISPNGSTIVSAYGFIVTFLGFVLLGTGASQFSSLYIDSKTKTVLTIKSITIERFVHVKLNLVKSTLFISVLAITIITMFESPNIYQSTLDYFYLIIAIVLLYLFGQLNITEAESDTE